MASGRLSYEQAYPGLRFRPRSRNWWARLAGSPAECVHLETEQRFMASLAPDALYLRGRRRLRRRPFRPEVSLCRECLLRVAEAELVSFSGRMVAFEPDPAVFSQYFFVAGTDFEPAGVEPAVAAALLRRLEEEVRPCADCGAPGTWLWLSRLDVESLDDSATIAFIPGERLCARHGARRLARSLSAIEEANLFYVNLPYAESGAYLWI